MKKVPLRPTGPGNWRPLVLVIEAYPRVQGSLFRGSKWREDSIDADRELAKRGDTWVVNGRAMRVAKVEEVKR